MAEVTSVPDAAAEFERAAQLASTSQVAEQRHVGRWIAGAVCLFLFAFAINSVATNRAIGWNVIGRYLTAHAILSGLGLTLWLTAVVDVLAFILGTVLAAMRMSHNPILRLLSWFYTWIFRSIPLLVQLLLWFNIGYLYPHVSLGIPFGPTFVSGGANNLISATVAAIIGLTLHDAAYASEIVRGGFLSVDQGQLEAAQALALSRRRILGRILLPQAMRSIIPASVNLVTGTLKATAVVSVISVQDLLFHVETIYSANLLIIPLLCVATIWYIIAVSALSLVQYYLERHFARGALRQQPLTPWQRIRQMMTGLDRRQPPSDPVLRGSDAL